MLSRPAPLPHVQESVEERGHAELLMDYQNLRGGKVKLQSIMMPEMEFSNPEKGGLAGGAVVACFLLFGDSVGTRWCRWLSLRTLR